MSGSIQKVWLVMRCNISVLNTKGIIKSWTQSLISLDTQVSTCIYALKCSLLPA